jgi:hypothetical protein
MVRELQAENCKVYLWFSLYLEFCSPVVSINFVQVLFCRIVYSRFSDSNQYGMLCFCNKDPLLSLKVI